MPVDDCSVPLERKCHSVPQRVDSMHICVWACAGPQKAVAVQICKGILALHACQPALAHRDIKPHNVLLQRHKQHDSEAAVPIGSHSNPGDDLEAQSLHAVGAEPPDGSPCKTVKNNAGLSILQHPLAHLH